MTRATPSQAFFPKRSCLCCLLPVLLGVGFGYDALAQQRPDSFDSIAAAAAAARDRNDIQGAIRLYAQAEQLKPAWASGWWSLGLLQYAARTWSEAAKAFTHYIELSPGGTATVAQATALRGLCALQLGDFQQSLDDLQQSLSFGVTNDPQNAVLLRLRQAQVLTRLGRFDEALDVYSSLARAVPPGQRSAEWNMSAGLAGLRSPQLPADVPVGEQPRFAAAGDAALRSMSGDETGARDAFSDLFVRFPNAPNAHFLCASLISPVDPDGAVVEYQKELEVAPGNAAADAMLARVLLYQAKPAQALPFAQKAANGDPASPVAQLVLGRSLAETGALPSGIEHLEKALQLQPAILETHIALATAYSSAGRQDDARRERLQSLAMAEAYHAQP